MIPQYSLRQIAEMKKEFVNSAFGKFAAMRINEIYGDLHGRAESAESAERQARYVNQAAGVNLIISFFTADVELLEQGYFNEKEGEQKQA